MTIYMLFRQGGTRSCVCENGLQAFKRNLEECEDTNGSCLIGMCGVSSSTESHMSGTDLIYN